ncbi:LysR family transcriptional regulator [Myxococcus sp. K38C18041901]|uniref:LysR family transcriptional regulator n=1 Tax=Myxococcus guangdongensis TaxID=2906760 RepID=UPI0020A764B9|nr:LysR family transcriptional regulator [Myxococcus guangdongensis]MCP3060125.1 LysR family transcriptional regulator [Myxococcus guangdongensis]
MDWNDLRYFLALARLGSVRAAGAALGVSHSTVVRRVDALEFELRTRLFDRHRNGFVLTDAGERMMPAAVRVEDEVCALTRGAAGHDESLSGTVHLTCICWCARRSRDGVDISRNMIAIAHRKAAAAGTANVVFHAQPSGTLATFTDAQFDCVCAYNLLHLLDDPAALLRAMYRVTVPGGTLVTSTACLGGPWGRSSGASSRWLGKAPRVTVLRRDKLRAAVADVGFVDIETPDVGDSTQNVFLIARKPR